MKLLTTNTSSNAASSSFTSGIDSTYKLYIFKFYDVNPVTDGAHFTWQANATDSTSYDEEIHSTFFLANHNEADGETNLGYQTTYDQARGTAYQTLSHLNGNGSDESSAGELHLFNPASTTYVKHFYSRVNNLYYSDYSMDNYSAGYINTATAIDDIQFKMSTGNMDAVIKMYGVS